MKNPLINQEAVLLYALGAAGLFVFLGTGNYLFLIGLLGPVLGYRLIGRVRWLVLRTGGTTDRALKASSREDREELHKIKEAITQSISKNG